MKRLICLILVLSAVFTVGCAGTKRTDEPTTTSINIDELLSSASDALTTPSANAEPTESDGTVSDYYTSNASAGDRVSFRLYKIEPEYTVSTGSYSSAILSDRDRNYICKCYVDAAYTEYLYMYISGADYCDNITMEDTVYSLSYILPLTIVADAVYSDTLVDDFSTTTGSIISYKFSSVSGKASYDQSKAVAYTDSLDQWQECYVDSIYSIEITSYTYHSEGATFGGNVIDYLICVGKKTDGSSIQMAIHLKDYNEYLNDGEDVVFNTNSFAIGNRLSGNTDVLYFNTPLKLYGFAQESGMILEDSEYASIFMFHCPG